MRPCSSVRTAIEAPYRRRDWAAKSDGITGDELLAFINNEEATLPNGKKGAGLFAWLRQQVCVLVGLTNASDSHLSRRNPTVPADELPAEA